MIKKYIILPLLLGSMSAPAQQYFTKNGHVSFFSKAPIENIHADNNQVISVIDMTTGVIQFSLLNNVFHFAKATMEDHFNEDYMESTTYPKTTFKGKIENLSQININRDGTYNVTVSGELLMHGVTKKIVAPATITIKKGNISGHSVFQVALSDYNIHIPSIVKDHISNNIEITADCDYQKK